MRKKLKVMTKREAEKKAIVEGRIYEPHGMGYIKIQYGLN